MARTLNKLTDATARSSRLLPGRHSDGGGLYLNVKEGGSRSWMFLFKRDGVRRGTGLGAYPAVSLNAARKMAGELRALLELGQDPRVAQEKQRDPTFAECAELFLASMGNQWRNERHRAQWRSTLGVNYCQPIVKMKVSAIETRHVLEVLSPIWHEKPETASRIRGRIERVLDYAKAMRWRGGENPALWRGNLKSILPPRRRLTRGHHPAMPYADVPAFMTLLRGRPAMAARALEFLILTSARSGEVLGARWSELDLAAAVWTVPAERMKAGRAHRVPLTNEVIAELLKLKSASRSEFVFPGQREARPLSSMALEMQLRRMNLSHYTVHGFRSAFRDWAADETDFAREIAEEALAHVVGNATERAYRRSDALERRRVLMETWANHCLSDLTP